MAAECSLVTCVTAVVQVRQEPRERSVDRMVGFGLERTDVFVRDESSLQEFDLVSRGSVDHFLVIGSELPGNPTSITYAKIHCRKLFSAVIENSDALFHGEPARTKTCSGSGRRTVQRASRDDRCSGSTPIATHPPSSPRTPCRRSEVHQHRTSVRPESVRFSVAKSEQFEVVIDTPGSLTECLRKRPGLRGLFDQQSAGDTHLEWRLDRLGPGSLARMDSRKELSEKECKSWSATTLGYRD